MNPATPGPLTILLVPPPGDTALLADEAGGKVPKLTWCYSEYTDRDFWARPGPGARPHEGAQAAVGLLLVSNGAPVAMGCDRAATRLAVFDGTSVGVTAPEWGEGYAWEGWGFHVGAWHGRGTTMYHAVPLRKGWGPHNRREVPELARLGPPVFMAPEASRRLRKVHALAIACAARLGGRVVALSADGREVTE